MIVEYIAGQPSSLLAVLAALLSGFFLFRNSRENSFREAASSFRKAFDPTITKLMHSNEDVVGILESAFSDHEEAVREFSKHLFWTRRSFEKLWREYAFHPEAEIRFLEAYTSVGVSIPEAKSNRELAIKRLRALVHYAKP